jgi:hypothetical protein
MLYKDNYHPTPPQIHSVSLSHLQCLLIYSPKDNRVKVMMETVQVKIRFNQTKEEPSGVQILQWKEQHNRTIVMEVSEFKK